MSNCWNCFHNWVHQATTEPQESEQKADFPKIASWLAMKEGIISSKKPYGLVMTAWYTPEEAKQIKSVNPKAKLLAGLTVNEVWDTQEWITFLRPWQTMVRRASRNDC